MQVLGIESSCDETAVAVVTADKEIKSHVVRSQLKEHAPYGGVVPEIAARAHIEVLDKLIPLALEEANINNFKELDAIAVTSGPGLIGGVIVGVMVAKGIASVSGVPLLPINHLEGHALTARLTDDVPFPFLLLLVSGGHCQILVAKGVDDYDLLGATIDDALGEAYDKVAKMMGLGYPGGPVVERLAKDGDGTRFAFPRALKGRKGCDFSFSGVKTAVKREVDKLRAANDGKLNDQDVADICASFQYCAKDILIDRLQNAVDHIRAEDLGCKHLVIAGGVAANRFLYGAIESAFEGYTVVAPPLKLCTDNAAMIAWAGIEHLKWGAKGDLSVAPRARWPLSD